MPAGSERSRPLLPRRFRPLGVRLAVGGFGGLLVVVCAAAWFAFPPSIRAQFTAFQVLTILALGAGFATMGYALARCRLDARENGLTVVNGFRTRHFEWNEVLSVTLRPGSPWAVLDLSDGTSTAAMGIQGSDGARAARHVRELRHIIDVLTTPPQDD